MKKVLIFISSLIGIGIVICILLILDIYDKRIDYSISLSNEKLLLGDNDSFTITNNGKYDLYIWTEISFPKSDYYEFDINYDKEYILLKPKDKIEINIKRLKVVNKYLVNNIYCTNKNNIPNSIDGYSLVKSYNIEIKSK